jgi:hypothetical protein
MSMGDYWCNYSLIISCPMLFVKLYRYSTVIYKHNSMRNISLYYVIVEPHEKWSSNNAINLFIFFNTNTNINI